MFTTLNESCVAQGPKVETLVDRKRVTEQKSKIKTTHNWAGKAAHNVYYSVAVRKLALPTISLDR